MLSGAIRRTGFQRLVLFLMMVWVGLLPVLSVQAQQSSAGSGGGIKMVCKPDKCFANQAAKDAYAVEKNCQFLEDVCSKSSTGDNKGMKPGDESIWGKATNFVKQSGLVYGYEFVLGIVTGIKDQIKDLMDFVMNLDGVMDGLYELGKSFYNDPKGTLKLLGEMLGQGVVDTIAKATQCGPYDLGHVIGSYISPALALKLATKLTKFNGNLGEAVRDVRKDLGCASFVAGTPVWTPEGMIPIEKIIPGQSVQSRNEGSFADQVKTVREVFWRVAPTYRLLKTEIGPISLTDEHPIWVQGQGWTEAKDVERDDVVSGSLGDSLVLANELVRRPIKVHNFSVQDTPNYFAGIDGLWVHNANCDLPPPYRAPRSPSGYKIGESDGGPGKWVYANRGSHPANWKNYETQVAGSPKNIEYEVGGIKFDGYDHERDVLLDPKNYTESNILAKGPDHPHNEKVYPILLNKALRDAKAQRVAAGSIPIEWHVSNEKAANALRELFENDPDLKRNGMIKVIYTPDIVD